MSTAGSFGNLGAQSSCKFFLRFDETSGENFADAVTGSVLQCTSGIVDVARTIDYAVDLSYVAPINDLYGYQIETIGFSPDALPLIDTSVPLLTCAGVRVIDSNDVRIPLGAQVGTGTKQPGFTVSYGTTLHSIICDGTNQEEATTTATTLVAGDYYIIFASYDPLTETLTAGAVSADGTLYDSTSKVLASAPASFTPWNGTRPGGASYYFWGLWQPSTMPTDAQLYAGAQWMLALAQTGRKAPYYGPGWQ